MSECIKFGTSIGLLLTIMNLQGCVRLMYPTSDNELVIKSLNGGVSAEVETNYVDAYVNLKQAYKKCVEIKSVNGSLLIDSNLDRDNQIATFYGSLPYGALLFKTTLVPINEKSTKLTYYSLKTSILTENANQNLLKKRLEQDQIRALGQDKECNKN